MAGRLRVPLGLSQACQARIHLDARLESPGSVRRWGASPRAAVRIDGAGAHFPGRSEPWNESELNARTSFALLSQFGRNCSQPKHSQVVSKSHPCRPRRGLSCSRLRRPHRRVHTHCFDVAPLPSRTGARRARQGFPSALRGLDPPDTVPSGLQLPERRRDHTCNFAHMCAPLREAWGRSHSCALTNRRSKPHHRFTMFFSLA